MESKEFKIGQHVKIVSLAKHGDLLEIRSDGTAKVSLGNITISCKLSDLQAAQPKTKTEKTRHKFEASRKRVGSLTAKIDLHGKTVEEALRLVEDAISRAIVDDSDELQIMHGFGTGKLKIAIHNYLSTLTVVQSFKLDDANQGITRVFF